MTKKVVRPILPVAPNQYDQVCIKQLARALEFLIDEVRDAKIIFQGIPGSGAANALERGDFFIADGGFIKVIVAEDFYSGSVQATGAVGTVTISVS